jgi:hypothetical protein
VVRQKKIFMVDFCLLLSYISLKFFFLKINVVKSVFYALKSVIFAYFVRRFTQKQLLTEKSKLVQMLQKLFLMATSMMFKHIKFIPRDNKNNSAIYKWL